MNDRTDEENLVSIQRLTRDLAKAATTLSADEARFLVDAYYAMQRDRIRSNNQVRALDESEEPHSVLGWLAEQSGTLEKQIARALDQYSRSNPLGVWARSVVGIGPVISAGLLAHIDITRAPTCGHVWRFAGLDPTSKWEKGKKRPHNAALKTLCWKIGESFVKVKGNDDDVYGKVYAARRLQEGQRNESGAFAEQAAAIAKARPTHAQIKTYKEGKLPEGHLHARAKRYAVKLFLAHYWETGRKLAGLPVPLPYPVAHLGHAHIIPPGFQAIARPPEGTIVDERANESESTRPRKRSIKRERTKGSGASQQK